MKRRSIKRNLAISGLAAVLLAVAACSSSDETSGLPSHKEGNETVYTSKYHVDAVGYESTVKMAENSALVFEGRVKSASANAVEVQPSGDAEGAFAGEGPDIYGTITFEVIKVLKGDKSKKEITITFESGKRQDKKTRIAYVQEGLSGFQFPTGEIKKVEELSKGTYVVFANPNQNLPVDKNWYVQSHPSGIGKVVGDDKPIFASGNQAEQPIASSGQISLKEMREKIKD